jgi:RNA-binding motif X-linked protein 2
MNTVRAIQKMNELELKNGVSLAGSWHADYLKSPWVFVGGLDYALTEGDAICVMSQVGPGQGCFVARRKMSLWRTCPLCD